MTNHFRNLRVNPFVVLICSTNLPGVHTNTSILLPPLPSSSTNWACSSDSAFEPTAVPIFSPVPVDSERATACTCETSSLVGTTITARRRVTTRVDNDCTIGRMYANVFPDPVAAEIHISPESGDRSNGMTID